MIGFYRDALLPLPWYYRRETPSVSSQMPVLKQGKVSALCVWALFY